MPGSYSSGEKKVRPGVYYRTTNGGGNETVGARNGIAAAVFKANWGPVGEVVTLSSPSEINEYFGDESVEGSNVSILNNLFNAGASVVKAVRVGSSDGTNAAITLTDTESVEVVTLTAKYAGTRALSVTIKDSLALTGRRELIVYSGTKEMMKVVFVKGTNEVDGLMEAIAEAGEQSILYATKVAAGNGTLKPLAQVDFTTAGASPAITNESYSDAFTLLEAEQFNSVCIDSNENALHVLLNAFVNRAAANGIMCVGFVGEPTTVPFATRKQNAVSFNSPTTVYVGNGFYIAGEKYEGWKAASYACGYYAYLPCNDSLTHKTIPGAAGIVGPMTNTQIIEALQSGIMLFSYSATHAVWIEQGINTLTSLTADQDAGWKKLRRVKTRHELMQRLNESCEPLIGAITNDNNGRNTLTAIGNGIIGEMIAERKLLSGSMAVDTVYVPEGDSVWFKIAILDLDSIEKVYMNYQFRFSED